MLMVCTPSCVVRRDVESRCETGSRRVAGEDVVAVFDGAVAFETALERGGVGEGLAVVELGVQPAAGRRVLLRVLDHELHAVLRVAGDERLAAAEGLVVLLRRVEAPGDP